jgi:hypothetical protein
MSMIPYKLILAADFMLEPGGKNYATMNILGNLFELKRSNKFITHIWSLYAINYGPSAGYLNQTSN